MSDLSFPEIVEPPLPDSTPAPTPVAAELVDKAEITGGKVLVAYNRTTAALAELTKRYKDAKFDLTTTKGDKAARAARAELTTLRTDLERKRLELKRPALDFGKKIDEEAKRITNQIEALEKPIDAQIKADEQRREREKQERDRIEAERKAKHETGIATIRGYLQQAQGLPAMRIASGIALLEGMTFGAEWEEFVELAIAARDETLAALRKLHDDTLAAELRAVEEARIRKEHADQQQALQIGQKALALMGKPAREIREQLNLLELTVYPEGTAAVVQQAHDSAAATLTTMLQLAEEREQRLAEEAAAKTKADEAIAAMTPVAPPAVDPPAPTVGELQEQAADEPVAIHSTEYPEGRDSQQVLKAEALGPDATDREPPADASPSVGSMGAEQPADAGLAGEDESTMPAGSRGGVAIDMALSAADAGKVAEFIDAMTTTEALREALHLVEYLRGPFTGRFPTQPKPSTEWWAGLRTQLDSLQPRLHSALGIEVTP